MGTIHILNWEIPGVTLWENVRRVRWEEMRGDEKRWDEMRWDEMRWDEMRWDEMRWNEMRCDGMGWDEMRLDEMTSLRWLCSKKLQNIAFLVVPKAMQIITTKSHPPTIPFFFITIRLGMRQPPRVNYSFVRLVLRKLCATAPLPLLCVVFTHLCQRFLHLFGWTT